MPVDPTDPRPTITIDATRPVADQLPPAATPDNSPVSLTPGLLQALGAELVAKPRPEPIETSHLITRPFPASPTSYYVNRLQVHLGPQHGRVEIDVSVSDHQRLRQYQVELERGAAVLQDEVNKLATELQRGPLAEAVRNTRGRIAKAEADEAKLRAQLADLEAGHRDALLAGQDPEYPMKQADAIRAKVRSIEVLKDALRPVLQAAEARYAEAVKSAKHAARAAWIADAEARERTAETQLVEAVTDAAVRLELVRAQLQVVANEQNPVYAPFDADVS
jgi:hypothetical protein